MLTLVNAASDTSADNRHVFLVASADAALARSEAELGAEAGAVGEQVGLVGPLLEL